MRLLLLLALPAFAAPVKPTQATASTSYPMENGVRYDPANLLDGRVTSCWIEGERGSGLGSWVQLDLGEAREVRGVRLWNGNQASTDLWQRHNRMKDIELAFSDGSKLPFTLPDTQAPQTLTFPKAVTTTFVKLKFKSVYSGTTFGDTPLSELQVLDGAPEDHAVPVSVKASTTYPADADASYDAANVADGMEDTAWCEGDKKGDGTSQWIEMDFGSAVPLTTMRVRNGNAASAEENAGANQPTGVRLTFDDGSTAEVTWKAGLEAQEVRFPAHTSKKVRLTFTTVAKGTTYNDLCVSEVVFGG